MTLFLCFALDDGYQIGRRVLSDTRRPILYNLMCFVQRARAEINPWVITNNVPQIQRQTKQFDCYSPTNLWFKCKLFVS